MTVSERVAHPKMHGLIASKSNLILLSVVFFFGQSRKIRLGAQDTVSWIGYTIDTQTGLIHANEERIQKLSSELEQICANLQLSDLVHVRLLASIVGQIISLSASCGSVTLIMTRYLHIIINSRRSWNSDTTRSHTAVDWAIYAIHWAHGLAGIPSPTDSPIIHGLRQTAKRFSGT